MELNHERAEEEANGNIRWLRPEFQDPDYEKKAQAKSPLPSGEEGQGEGGTSKPKKTKKPTKAKVKKPPWPKTLPARITAVRSKLVEHGQPADVAALAKYFTRANKENLETLVAVGQARLTDDGRFAAWW